MKGRILVFVLVLIFLTPLAWGESVKKRLSTLEDRVELLEEEVKAMVEVSETVDKNIEFYADETLPEVGEAKFVKGEPLVLDDCDATTQWSVHSGAGVTIAVGSSDVYQGTGSILVTVPAGVTAIVKATKSSGSWDLSAYNYLRLYLRRHSLISSFKLYFGEAAYNEQSKTTGVTPPAGFGWTETSWDTSAIAAASKNGVTIFAVEATNTDSSSHQFSIDYLFADPGPSQFMGNDGDSYPLMWPPPAFAYSYAGNSSAGTVIPVARKGVPILVMILNYDAGGNVILWTTGMGSNSKNVSSGALVSNRITAVAEGGVTVGSDADVNTSGRNYILFAWFADEN